MKRNIKIFTVVFAFFSLFFSSCVSSKKPVDELTAKQLIQEGQNAFDKRKFKLAIQYYETAIERFGSEDAQVFVESKYEIGHIYMRQKKYDKAKTTFEELFAIYSKFVSGQLPGAYLKLSQLEMEKIPEKYKNDE